MLSELKEVKHQTISKTKWVSTHQKLLVCYIDVSAIL